LNSVENKHPKLFSVVGYGTFITKHHWQDKSNVEVCKVKNYKRIFPPGCWFPYVLPCKESSFWALKFDVNEHELNNLDYYEGVSSNLFKRVKIQINLKDHREIKAFIYIPTEQTIASEKLTLEIDENDRWKEEIKKFPNIIKKFPQLLSG
jgi:gamma-glutamylcyclotransferase (GGCT)/AIG2-like uncharacterized protein YtfP